MITFEKKNIIHILAKCLVDIKNEHNKRDEIRKHGVDLANYENGYLDSLLNLINFHLNSYGDDKDDEVNWWLFERTPKIIYLKGGQIINLEKPEDFIEYMLNRKNE